MPEFIFDPLEILKRLHLLFLKTFTDVHYAFLRVASDVFDGFRIGVNLFLVIIDFN